VATSLNRAEENVSMRLQESYSWLIVPVQTDPTGPVELQAHRINGQDSFYERAGRKLRSSGWLIPNWSPDNLKIELDNYLWRGQPHVGLKQLWAYFARYCYLPRLTNENVLKEAVRDGVARDGADTPFGYATLAAADGTYKGLVFRKPVMNLYFDDSAVVVRPEVAEQQLATAREAQPVAPAAPAADDSEGASRGRGREEAPTPAPRLARRYHGTVALDAQRANREMSMLVEEIIQRLTSLTGTNVEITVEISAERAAGFDDATVRTISENSRTLRFKSHAFEGE
jgi:hypothetical protein